MARNFLFEVSPINKTTKLPETWRFASKGANSNGTQLNGYEWKPVITSGPRMSFGVFSQGQVQASVPSFGDVQFYLDTDHGTLGLSGYNWDGALGRIWIGDDTNKDFTSYRKIFEGSCGAHSFAGMVMKVGLYGADAVLDETDFLTATYAGTGGAEGGTDIKGNYKPVAYGECLNVEPVLIDSANRVYQVHSGAISDIVGIYEGAIPIPKMVATATSYAQLIGLTLKEDEWAKAPAIGMFRMGGVATGIPTADVNGALDGGTYVTSLATILPLMLKSGGVLASSINQPSFNAFSGYQWSYFSTDQASVGEIVKGAISQAGGYMFANTNGVFTVASFFTNNTPVPINVDRSTPTKIVPRSVKLEEAYPPHHIVKIGGERVWRVLDHGDVAEAVQKLAADQSALEEAAIASAETLRQTVENADLALKRYDSIVADGILSRDEKAQLKQDWSKEIVTKSATLNSALNYAIDATAYVNAFQAAQDYLNTLSPAWDNTSADSPVNRSMLIQLFTDLENTKQLVLKSVAIKAGTLAGWDGIYGSGKPESNATVGAIVGGNLKGENGNNLGRDDVLNASGAFAANLTYTFDDNTAGPFSGTDATIAVANGILTITATSNDPKLYLTLSKQGKEVSVIRARIRAKADNQSWQGQVYYGNAGHSDSEGFTKIIANPGFRKDEWRIVEWDMNNLNAGGTDYIDNTTVRVRWDLAAANAEVWDIDWVQLGARVNGTLGAPVGTNVGNIPVSDVVSKFAALDASGFTDTTPPATPTGLNISSILTDAGVTLNASWNAVTAPDLSEYVFAIKEGSGAYYEFTTTSPSYTRTALGRNVAITGKVAARDKAGNISGYSAEFAHTTARDTVPPAVPTGVAVETTYQSASVSWVNPSDRDLSQITVRVYDAANNVIKTVNLAGVAGGTGNYIVSNLAKATTYKVNLQAFDTSGNGSAYSSTATFTTAGGVAAGDLVPNATFIQGVTSLPAVSGYTGASVVFFNGELYRLVNSAWVKSVSGADITTNTLPYASLASKPTSLADINAAQSTKLTGIKDGAGTIADTRDGNFAPSYYYALRGETQEFKNGNFAGSGSSGFGALVTVAQWGDPSGGPVKQTLTDSTGAIFERISISTTDWGTWGRNYNAVSKPKLGTDLLTSTGAVLTDTNTLNVNQQWTEVGGTGKPSDNAGTSVTFYDAQNGYTTRGNSFIKSNVGFNNSWQVNLWSRESYAGSAMVSGEFVGTDAFIGLSFNGQNLDTYTQLEFAIYARGDNQVEIHESGQGRGGVAVPPTGVFAITYDGVTVKYWNNNTVFWTTTVTVYPNWVMFAGFNAYRINEGVKNIQFSTFTDNAWGSVGGANRPADNATVGAPNGTYVGGTLAQTVADNANNPAGVINRNAVTIDGGKLTAGSVDTLQLKAGSVKAEQLLIGSMTALNPDPGFRDTSFWQNNGVYNGALGTSAGSVPAWYNSHGLDINAEMGTTHYCMLWGAYFKGAGRQHLISRTRGNIKGGTTYQFSALGNNACNQRIVVLCRMFNVDGVYIADASLDWNAAVGKQYRKAQFVAPTNATAYCFYVYNDAGVNFDGHVEVADLQVTEVSGSTAIENGAITTEKITVGTLDGDRIRSNSMHADKLVSNTITTGKIAIQNRPVSVFGVNLRVDKDGAVRWDRGVISFPDNNGNYITRTVVAGAWGWQGWSMPVNLCYDSNADNVGFGVYYTQDLPAYSNMIPVALWNNGTALIPRSGTGTLINGDTIVTGTVHGNKMIADSITANEIQAGAIGVAELAAGAVVTSKLAVGNTDNIVPDSEIRDIPWWNSGTPDARLTGEDVTFTLFRRALAIRPNGGIDVFSTMFPLEPGATYKITVGIDLAGDFSGTFRPLIHMPGVQWFAVKSGASVDPSTTDAAHVFTAAGTSVNIDQTYTNPLISQVRNWQFRITGNWSGTVRFAVKIIRVSDTTLIQNGAITTDKIVVGSLNGDRITSDTLDANKVKAGTVLAGSVVVGGAGKLGDIATQAANAGNNSWYSVASDRYTIANNKITKLANNDWDYNCYTNEMFTGACVMVGKLTGDGTFIGLSDGREGGNYGNLDYAWHRSQDGNCYIFENGGNVGSIGSNGAVGADSVSFSIVYDGKTVRYYRNEFLHREVATTADRRFAGGVGIAPPGSSVERLSFQPGPDNSLLRADVTGKINGGTTTINGGKITTGSIAAEQIASNTINASKLTINNRNITALGCDFRFEAGMLRWSEGHILYTDDAGNPSSPFIPAGAVAWNGGSYNYIVWDKGAGSFRQTAPDDWGPSQNNGSTSVIMCTWRGGSNFVAAYGGTIVSGDRIVTRSIDADRLNVGSLSAVSANIGLLRTAASGARTEIESNQIRVYDGNGTMRVRLGVW